MPQAIGALEFISILFGNNRTQGLIYFSSLPNDRNGPERGERRLLTRDPEQLQKFIAKHDKAGRGLFFCAGTIEGKRNKANVREIPGVWADLDFKGVDHTLEEIRAALAKLTHLPSLVVRSGHGLHLYWLLDKAVDAQAHADRLEKLLRALADHVGGDTQVCEIARLMRLPGTHNTKFDSWVPVEVEISTGAQYHLEELEEWLALDAKPILHRRPVANGHTPAGDGAPPMDAMGRIDNPFLAVAQMQGFKPPIDVDAMLAGMFVGPKGANGNIHASSLSTSAALLERGMDPEEVTKTVVDAVMAAAARANVTWSREIEERDWVRPMVMSWVAKHPREREPSLAAKVSGGELGRVPDGEPEYGQPDRTSGVVDLGAERAKRKAKPDPDIKQKKSAVPFMVADGLVELLREGGEDILLTEGDVWLYKEGFWRIMTPSDEQRMRSAIHTGFATLKTPPNTSMLNLAWTRLEQNPELHRATVAWADAGMVVCRNGVLKLDTGAFDRHSPVNYARRHIGATYTPGATCPTFQSLLASMFSDRPDADLMIALLQEWAGGALAVGSLSREQRRALVLVGPSMTGKTELAKIFALLFGDPIATPSVTEIGEPRFGLSALYGASAWVRDDAINEGDKLDPQRFKTVVTGEPVDVGRRYKQPIPSARFNIPVLLTCNSLPRARDGSDAIFNRSLIVRMTHEISQQKAKAERAKILGEENKSSLGEGVFALEAPGILNWALAGLTRLRKRGYYELPDSVVGWIQGFKDENNPVGEWARDCIERSPATKIERRDLVRSFNGWEHEQEGDEARSKGGRWLLPKLRTHIPGLNDAQGHGGKRYVVGLKLNETGLAMWESYAKAAQKPGGCATQVSDVNQVESGQDGLNEQVKTRSTTKF